MQAWASVRSYRQELELERSAQPQNHDLVLLWVRYPGRMRLEVAVSGDGAQGGLLFNAEGLFLHGPQGRQRLDGPMERVVRWQLARPRPELLLLEPQGGWRLLAAELIQRDGGLVYRLQAQAPDGVELELLYSAATLLLEEESWRASGYSVRYRYADYRPVGPLRIPHQVDVYTQEGRDRLRVLLTELNLELPEGLFW
ncbi:MAG: hypothetical protein N2561_03195 [Bacteroidetes bacterium]|nr:hypothetical protein [Rhodothermia bacterium]MCS7155666.1 hypothetical protein [Bacteroidota bacterium]MCX7906525.1 hypothetical protein [Bacteroidota bacterium]MDW8137194.1 hypothetical protein [Bacteroidota bacterium]MDW8284936.1 hypothetical protein [Bacteroidota bacterium]